MILKKTFPCAQCAADVDAAKLAGGPEFVFCGPACARRFLKRDNAGSLLSVYFRRVATATREPLLIRRALKRNRFRREPRKFVEIHSVTRRVIPSPFEKAMPPEDAPSHWNDLWMMDANVQ